MERDPVRFVWRTTPVLHVAGLVLVLLTIPLIWVGVDLVRVAIDDAIGGRAFATSATAPFLRFALDLPERIAEEPIVLLPGLSLDRPGFVLATVAALVTVALAASVIALVIGLLQAAAGTRAIDRVRRMILDGVVGARPAARDELRQAASLAGEGLAREDGFLGGAVLTPALAASAGAVGLVYALAVDWRLALALVVALGLIAFAWPRRFNAATRLADSRLNEAAALRRLLADLARRLPAVRAHGTADFERSRLSQDLAQRRRPVLAVEQEVGAAAALTMLALILAPVVILGAGAWFAIQGDTTAGEIVAVVTVAAIAVLALDAVLRWRRQLEPARQAFEEIARTLGALQSRSRPHAGGALPGSGVLAANDLSAYDLTTGARITGLNLTMVMPAHVALIGEPGAGARVFAALIGGQLDPSAGSLTFAGIDLPSIDPGERARRFAFAGGDTILIAGSLRQNLLYGCTDPDAPDIDQRVAEAVAAAGLDRFVHARGLAGTIDPQREPKLAGAIVDARRAVRTAIAAEDLGAYVDPFDPERYNAHATIGENILFGVPLGDTFRETNLPGHPFVRAILESEGLTRPLTGMGLAIATNMVEIFADIPDGHPLFDRFSFFTAAERGYFEALVARQGERRRDAESARDRERLMGLALRYSESRHRLGLLEPDVEARLVTARAAFARLLPVSLQPAIEFYHPDRLCAAASVQDNLLFGRVAQDRAGAEAEVLGLVRRVLTERGLDQDVFRVGLESRIDIRGEGLVASEIAAIDVARCLVRRPDTVVVEHALDGLAGATASHLVGGLRRALVGRGLVIVTSLLSPEMDKPALDMVVHFERGGVGRVEDRRREQGAELESV